MKQSGRCVKSITHQVGFRPSTRSWASDRSRALAANGCSHAPQKWHGWLWLKHAKAITMVVHCGWSRMTNDDHLDQLKQFSHFTLGPFKGMILPMITLITITTRRDVGLLPVTSLNMFEIPTFSTQKTPHFYPLCRLGTGSLKSIMFLLTRSIYTIILPWYPQLYQLK